MALQQFINLSSELCGFSDFTLRGTGYATRYYSTVVDIVGQDVLDRMFNVYAKLPAHTSPIRDKALRAEILAHDEFGPIARNIMKLWYLSVWYELPRAWHEKYGMYNNDRTFIPFPYGYPEALLWPSVGAHVPGAKPTGYGSWAEPPQILI